MHTVSLDLGESAASGSLAAETAVSVLTAEPAAPCLSRLTPSLTAKFSILPWHRRCIAFTSGRGGASVLGFVLWCGIQNLTVIRSPVDLIRMGIHRQILCGGGVAVSERKAVSV